jgi:hypothetical protein
MPLFLQIRQHLVEHNNKIFKARIAFYGLHPFFYRRFKQLVTGKSLGGIVKVRGPSLLGAIKAAQRATLVGKYQRRNNPVKGNKLFFIV